MSIQDNKDLVLRYTRLIEQGNYDAALDLVADDCVFWHPMSGDSGKAQTREVFRQMGPLLKDMKSEVKSLTAEADRVAVEVEVSATAPGGKSYRNRYHFLYQVRDGLIAASREYVDTTPIHQAFFAQDTSK
ncbi:MAG TPA: nuclear transport factor 2 family protein [Ramlibacter sp.]|nr:nuclear transport factor 2 family protein [Ramlibacter sp.]